MATINNINPSDLIKKTSEALKDTIKAPEWSRFVKTGYGKMNLPQKDDWYITRAASILRKIYLKGPIGTSKLKKVYTTKKNRGHKPERTTLASGKIIRTAIQQLEKAGLVIQAEKGVHKGRIVTPKGRSFLDKLAKK